MRAQLYCAALAGILFLATNQSAQASFLKKGYIANDVGEKCWYTQKVLPKGKHLHSLPSGNTRVLKFKIPSCMKDSGLGLGINKMMINNIVTKPYSHSDANFKTKEDELRTGSTFQKRGVCIQSSTYSQIGVVIEYRIKRNSIVSVAHASAIAGCK